MYIKYKKYFLIIVLFTAQLAFTQIYFENKAVDLGIDIKGNSSPVLGGVSFFDFDNDGWDDLTFASKDYHPVRFFKNNSGSFTEEIFNINIIGHSKQVLWVDYDNDNDNDLFVTKFDGVNKLYQNNGNFVFTDVTELAGFPNSEILFTFGASFGDYNNDGYLDIFLSNKDFNYIIPNQLYRNNGDGTFTDVTTFAGISSVGHLSFCSAFFDYNKDGFQDIYIANDNIANTNILYKNNGNGTFTDVSVISGTNISANAMSTTIDDYNDDGWLDIYITNTLEGNFLLKNNGNGTFTDIASSTGTVFNSWGWGANFLDADNDTDLDLYVSGRISDPNSGYLTYGFYECQPNYTFSIPDDAGFSEDQFASFSNAIGDINNDGYPDFVVANLAPDNHSLWKNSGGTNNWLKIKLKGVQSNANGFGTWIEVHANNKAMYRYTLCGEGFLGQNSASEFIGVANATNIDYVKITWLSGTVDYIENVTPNQTITIIEGENTLSVDDTPFNEFNIYPNPGNGFFNVDLNNFDTNESLEIYDVFGRKVRTKELNSQTSTVNLNGFSEGVYFFKIVSEKRTLIKKVIYKDQN